jgi:hypothetical protein
MLHTTCVRMYTDVLTLEDLITTRRSGPKDTFRNQFHRTINMKATDCRDHIYRLLAISTFPDKPILADYT